jgi:hypothetical protein
MVRHASQGALAEAVWALVLRELGVPLLLAILIPIDVVLFSLALIRWRPLPG